MFQCQIDIEIVSSEEMRHFKKNKINQTYSHNQTYGETQIFIIGRQ